MKMIRSCLYRGSRPKDLTELAKHGVTLCISLQSGIHEILHDDDYENALKLEEFGIRKIDYGMSDIAAPTPEDLKQIVELIVRSLDRGHVVLIHCLHGKDRTGMVSAAWRILREGWTAERAREEMFENGFHKLPYYFWARQLNKLEPKK